MLDDINTIAQRDPSQALGVAAAQYEQALFEAVVDNAAHDGREITSIVLVGMGGSALAALQLKTLLSERLAVPFEIIREYTLPGYVGEHTLVIASSYSGNTEETLESLDRARAAGAQLAVVASGGKLIDAARDGNITYVGLPQGLQPRMATIYNLVALAAIFGNFGLLDDSITREIVAASEWLREEAAQWAAEQPTEHNYAKQLALETVGKTPVFYGGPLTASLAYKWKISWNENAKNVAFWNQYPEFNHNEFMGWTSHPIEKPFAVIDLVSDKEHPRVLKRFALSDRLLSGQRPKAITINLKGDGLLRQILWADVLADFTSIYVAILNGVDPTPVVLIEKFKQELA